MTPTHKHKLRLDPNNNLVINDKISQSGHWTLTDNHDLRLTIKATNDTKSGKKILLAGRISSTEKNSLNFIISKYNNVELEEKQILALTGTWSVDKYNKLIFSIKKENSEHDILTLNNKWILNKHHRIVYVYEKANLIYKKRETHEVTFKGYWKILKNSRLYYQFETDNNTGISFKVGAATLEKNRIKYKITIGVEESNLIISGQWRAAGDMTIFFDIDYSETETSPLSIGAEYKLSNDSEISLKLSNGFEIKIEKNWLYDDLDTYIQYKQTIEESKLEVGLKWQF